MSTEPFMLRWIQQAWRHADKPVVCPRQDHRLSHPQVERLEERATSAGIFATGADAGAVPEVRIFDAQSRVQRAHFLAYPASFRGGVRVAIGDVTADSVPDISTVPGIGGATVAGTNQGFGTLTLRSLAGSFFNHNIQVQLLPASVSTAASVTITNMQQFTS